MAEGVSQEWNPGCCGRCVSWSVHSPPDTAWCASGDALRVENMAVPCTLGLVCLEHGQPRGREC